MNNGKKYIIFWLLCLTFHFSNAQDLIVTNDGDSIECKITRITSDFIHFSVFDKSGILLMRSRLPVSQIRQYKKSEISSEENEPQQPSNDDRVVIEEFKPAKIRLSLNSGYTYQFGGYDGLPQAYKSQVQSLWNIGGELHYFIWEDFGIGGKYNRISTKANQDFEPPVSTAFGFSSLRDEYIKFNYLAVSLLYRSFLYDDHVMNYFLSGGVISYRTDGKGDGIPFYQEGQTFGLAFGISTDLLLTENFGIGLGGELNIAQMSEFDNNGTVVPASFSLTRIDLTIGVRFLK
ncbi:hypothetical protein [Ekhidna sp.]|uniref:hypothetical protein n=1 Tax=Ekhidna sp. TaxID=2608089 RepID=UPI003B50B332